MRRRRCCAYSRAYEPVFVGETRAPGSARDGLRSGGQWGGAGWRVSGESGEGAAARQARNLLFICAAAADHPRGPCARFLDGAALGAARAVLALPPRAQLLASRLYYASSDWTRLRFLQSSSSADDAAAAGEAGGFKQRQQEALGAFLELDSAGGGASSTQDAVLPDDEKVSLLHLLTAEELSQLLPQAARQALGRAHTPKHQRVAAALGACRQQRREKGGGETWARALRTLGHCVKLSDAWLEALHGCHRVFFWAGGYNAAIAAQVLRKADLEAVRWPARAAAAAAGPAAGAAEQEQYAGFCAALAMEERLEDGARCGDAAAAFAAVEEASAALSALAGAAAACGAEPRAQRRLAQLLLRGVSLLFRQQKYVESLPYVLLVLEQPPELGCGVRAKALEYQVKALKEVMGVDAALEVRTCAVCLCTWICSCLFSPARFARSGTRGSARGSARWAADPQRPVPSEHAAVSKAAAQEQTGRHQPPPPPPPGAAKLREAHAARGALGRRSRGRAARLAGAGLA